MNYQLDWRLFYPDTGAIINYNQKKIRASNEYVIRKLLLVIKLPTTHLVGFMVWSFIPTYMFMIR